MVGLTPQDMEYYRARREAERAQGKAALAAFLFLAVFIFLAVGVWVSGPSDYQAMKACEVEFSHDVCVHTLR